MLQATARQLMAGTAYVRGLECSRRGDISVKGKGIMTTFYVNLTQDLDVVECGDTCEDTRGHVEVLEGGYTRGHVPLTQDLDVVEGGIMSEDTLGHVDVVEGADTDTLAVQAAETGASRIDVKKDSGFGSQGHLEVDKIKVDVVTVRHIYSAWHTPGCWGAPGW